MTGTRGSQTPSIHAVKKFGQFNVRRLANSILDNIIRKNDKFESKGASSVKQDAARDIQSTELGAIIHGKYHRHQT
jgi:hypothetical protein